jgi:hypothetical protein
MRPFWTKKTISNHGCFTRAAAFLWLAKPALGESIRGIQTRWAGGVKDVAVPGRNFTTN